MHTSFTDPSRRDKLTMTLPSDFTYEQLKDAVLIKFGIEINNTDPLPLDVQVWLVEQGFINQGDINHD